MRFKISEEIFEKFPQVNLGVLVCKNIDNKGTSEEIIRLIKEKEKEIKSTFNTETLSQLPKINVWRETYRLFGAKPSENKSSVENLYKLVLKGVDLRHINKVVDIYNFISLKHMVPVGGEDIDKIQGDVILTFAGPNESPVLLLGDKDPRPPHEGEVIYKDDISAICRRWNWREVDRTKFTEETKNCVLVIEGLPPVTEEDIQKIVQELGELVQKFCGGEVTTNILNQNNPSLDF